MHSGFDRQTLTRALADAINVHVYSLRTLLDRCVQDCRFSRPCRSKTYTRILVCRTACQQLEEYQRSSMFGADKVSFSSPLLSLSLSLSVLRFSDRAIRRMRVEFFVFDHQGDSIGIVSHSVARSMSQSIIWKKCILLKR